MVAVPLRREDEIIGALVVRRKAPGEFTPETCGLLETLASQSVVAIHNARLFRELEHKTRELEVASQHKSEFLASMSHELRTPLNAVIGFSDVLLDRMFGELNERQDEYVRDIRNSGRHLLELINEILDLSKVEAGRMELELGPVSLAEADRSRTRDGARARRRARDLAARDIAGDVGIVWADELKLKQVVLNLLTNAVKFTPDGGSVEIARAGRGRRGRGDGHRHRHRDRRGRAGADLRGLPARRARRADGRRAPASASRSPGGSSTCTAAGCG